jgi:hypothetical protein
MSTKKSRFQGLFEPEDKQTEQSVHDQAEQVVSPPSASSEETLKGRNQEIKKSRKQESIVPRIKTNYEIRADYVHAMKRLAVDDRRKIYELMEDAIGQYLERRKQNTPEQ